jgi:phosphoglycolate phosphatase
MANPARAVIFDLDGTLVDSLEDIATAMNEALADVGRPTHPLDAYRRFVGSGVSVLAERALVESDPALRDATVAAFRQRYAARLVASTRPYAGIATLLDVLVARGVPAAVLTNKPEPAARALVERLLGRWPWAAIIGDRADLPRKPDPTGARVALAALGTSASETLMIGDSDVDMQTAVAAGLIGVGALWGFRGEEELRAAGARVVVGRPEEVVALLG